MLAAVQDTVQHAVAAESLSSGRSVSLNGEWLLATDPRNVGRENKWFTQPLREAKLTQVPWIIQEAFRDYACYRELIPDAVWSGQD